MNVFFNLREYFMCILVSVTVQDVEATVLDVEI